MDAGRPFVVTVASEKGGVGKTTLATNLAVYLKALCEDLPVTVVSFDNHFSVDNMFAIGARRGSSVAGLFRDEEPAELVQIGEYGVQYLASERQLTPPDDDPSRLRAVLERSRLGGILIIDTRPVIDYFTRSALASADLLIVPVKDRPSLVNVASLLDAFAAAGCDPGHAWVLPSLIDARLKLRNDIGLQAFLTFSGRERGYQVLDCCIAKSPKVESLATGLSSRVFPVLTHARGTIVHQQLRKIADFVLAEVRRRPPHSEIASSPLLPPGRLRRLLPDCPLCSAPLDGAAVHLLHDQRSRQRGGVHDSCLARLFGAETVASWRAQGAQLLLCDLETVGLSSEGDEALLRLFDRNGESLQSRPVRLRPQSPFEALLCAMSGRNPGEFFRERLFIGLDPAPLADLLADPRYRPFHALRRRVLRHEGCAEPLAGEFSC